MQSFCCYFFCQSKSAANQRTNLLYFSRGINVETESWIGLLFTIYDCIMPKVQEQEGKKADLSWFCQVCRHVVSDRSNNSGASWPSLIYTQLYQTSEPFHLTVVSLTEKQKFSSEKKKKTYAEVQNIPKDCSSALFIQIGKQFPSSVCFVLYNRPGCDKLGVDWVFVSKALI